MFISNLFHLFKKRLVYIKKQNITLTYDISNIFEFLLKFLNLLIKIKRKMKE